MLVTLVERWLQDYLTTRADALTSPSLHAYNAYAVAQCIASVITDGDWLSDFRLWLPAPVTLLATVLLHALAIMLGYT